MNIPPRETEIKIPVADLEAVRQRLLESGGELEQPMAREKNVLLDTDRQTLKEAGEALRIRTWASRHRLTFKGPASYEGPVKIREELETSVGDAELLLALLGRLGFRPWIRYEKDRETWRFRQSTVTLDHTPMGDFVEIEGPTETLQGLAETLGMDPNQALPESYVSLWQMYRLAHELGPDMVFDE